MKRHLVIGGAGFIGCNLVDYLLKRGKDVTVFDNLSRRGALNNIYWLKNNHSKWQDGKMARWQRSGGNGANNPPAPIPLNNPLAPFIKGE